MYLDVVDNIWFKAGTEDGNDSMYGSRSIIKLFLLGKQKNPRSDINMRIRNIGV